MKHMKSINPQTKLSHLFMKLSTSADLFHLMKVFLFFSPYYADLLWNWASFLLSPYLTEALSVAFYGHLCPQGYKIINNIL